MIEFAEVVMKNGVIESFNNLVFTLDSFSLLAAAIVELVIFIISIMFTYQLWKRKISHYMPLMISFDTWVFFSSLANLLRVLNLLTYTDTFVNSPWSLPLTMCRVASFTSALGFLITYIIWIWNLRLENASPKKTDLL